MKMNLARGFRSSLLSEMERFFPSGLPEGSHFICFFVGVGPVRLSVRQTSANFYRFRIDAPLWDGDIPGWRKETDGVFTRLKRWVDIFQLIEALVLLGCPNGGVLLNKFIPPAMQLAVRLAMQRSIQEIISCDGGLPPGTRVSLMIELPEGVGEIEEKVPFRLSDEALASFQRAGLISLCDLGNSRGFTIEGTVPEPEAPEK